MDKSKRKELLNEYKSKKVIGGVYCIECTKANKRWLMHTANMDGAKNRFSFAMGINSCYDPSMEKEWLAYGKEAFSFVVLEEITKGETQSTQEFAEDVLLLYKMWKEKQTEGDNK